MEYDNNKAIVASIQKIEEIPGADRIVAATVLGHTVVVSKDTKVGDLGIFFNDGLALSKEFMERNNLLHKVDANNVKIPGSGFFTESGRVRAQKFKGVRSEGFFCPVSYLKEEGKGAVEGLCFDAWKEEIVCSKYETPATKRARQNLQKQEVQINILKSRFPQHVDTKQWRFYKDNAEGILYFTEKLHGTSVRVGNIKVPQKLPWWKKFLNLFGNFYDKEKHQIILGTRRAILSKDKNGKYTGGFYGDGRPYSSVVNNFNVYQTLVKFKDTILYGEIVGYVDSTPLFKQTSDKLPEIKKLYGRDIVYDYGCLKGESRFYVYRVVRNGKDLSWNEVKAFCTENLLDYVPEYPTGTSPYLEGPSLLSNRHPTEGYVIREEITQENGTLVVNFFKEKSFTFKVLEGIVKDTSDNVDIEEIQG